MLLHALQFRTKLLVKAEPRFTCVVRDSRGRTRSAMKFYHCKLYIGIADQGNLLLPRNDHSNLGWSWHCKARMTTCIPLLFWSFLHSWECVPACRGMLFDGCGACCTQQFWPQFSPTFFRNWDPAGSHLRLGWQWVSHCRWLHLEPYCPCTRLVCGEEKRYWARNHHCYIHAFQTSSGFQVLSNHVGLFPSVLLVEKQT